MEDTDHLWEGRAANDWVRTLSLGDDMARWKAVDALRHIASPTDTIPLFIDALKDPYGDVRGLAAHALYDMAEDEEFAPLLVNWVRPLAEALCDRDEDVACNAAFALNALGTSATGALSTLFFVAECGDEPLREAASEAIAKIRG